MALVALGAACLDISGLNPPAAGSADASDARDDTSLQDGGLDTGDGLPTWTLYARFDQRDPPWGEPVSLDAFFGTQPNAPPPRDISTISYASSIDRLLVFTNDGRLFVRAGLTWLPPVPANSVFTTLGVSVPRSGYVLPERDGGTSSVTVTLVDNPTAYLFTYDGTAVAPLGTPVTLDDVDGGPPQASGRVDWDFEVYQPPSNVSPETLNVYVAYGSDIYGFDVDVKWSKWTPATFPYFAGDGAPPPERVRAAFYDSRGKILYMVVE